MRFTGIHELTIDDKNRLSIPAGFRAAMDREEDGDKFYLVPGDQTTGEKTTTLNLYPDRYFVRYAEKVLANLKDNRERDRFVQSFYALATLLEIDKQGRVSLPQWMLQRAGIIKLVALTGAWDHLILWDRGEYQSFIDSTWDSISDLRRKAQGPPVQT